MFQKIIEKLHGRQKGTVTPQFPPDVYKPILRKSICTGETTAGFKELNTGKYTEVMLIRGEKDLKQFMNMYGITEQPETEY